MRFVRWLSRCLISETVPINQAYAPLHVLAPDPRIPDMGTPGLVLVSPAIF